MDYFLTFIIISIRSAINGEMFVQIG